MAKPGGARERLTVLAIYPWPDFWSMGVGCGAPSFHLSVTAYARHGHEAHVLMPGPAHAPREEDYHGVTLHRFRTSVNFMPDVGRSKAVQHIRRFFSYLYWFARAVPAALALASRVRPDVVVGMGQLGPPVAFVVGRARRIPNVTRMFGTLLNQVFGHPLKLMLQYRELAAFRVPADYLILCDDGSGADLVARRLGVDMSRVLFWPNGVDKRAYSTEGRGTATRQRLGIPRDRRVVLSVSRLHPEKGVARLIGAAPAVIAERDDVVFLVVGGGGEAGALEEMARRLGVLEYVVFAGAVRQADLPDVYGAADIFVTLSDRTNVVNPLHEAMISGLAVVALDTGRTGEIVVDGRTGVLLPVERLEELPAVILGLLADDERRLALGAAARRSADERLPTFEERQAWEVEAIERAVAERRASGRREDP